MTIPKGCDIMGIRLEDVAAAFEAAGYSVVGASGASGEPGTEEAGEESAAVSAAGSEAGFVSSQGAAQDTAPEAKSNAGSGEVADEAARAEMLKSYVARLSSGELLEQVRAEFVENFSDVDASEIVNAEQSLIDGGAQISDVQCLCDVHSALFHGATREERIARAESAVMESLYGRGDAPSRSNSSDAMASTDSSGKRPLASIPGHPMNVFTRENQAISQQIERARAALGTPSEVDELRKLSALGIHYAKKGDLIYPILKVGYGVSGPSEVMWGVDDEIRAEIRSLLGADSQDEGWRARAEKVLTRAEEMIYKETNILLPLCARNFTDDEWLQVYVDMKDYEPCFIDDEGVWAEGEEYFDRARSAAEESLAGQAACSELDAESSSSAPGEIRLPSGHLTPAQLDAMLNTLPVEITFIDDSEINRYWNDGGEKRLFKRPAAAIDRKVWDCHPPNVQQMVQQVISALRSGEKDSVDIWMEKGGEPVLVRYMAVRNREGVYQGTMEVVQRMGFAKEHFEAGR